MDYIAELTAIAKEHGGIIETKIAAQYGISKAMLYKLCKEDKIHRIVKGQYILPDDMEDELLSISKRSTQIIFSHETALFLHGISDRTPFEHTITAPSGCIPSAAIKAECKVYYIKPELFDLGKTELKTPAGMFPEAHIQMVSSVINPKGSARDGFSRSDEYIFFVMFGECTPARLPLSNEWSSSAIVSAQEKRDDDITEKRVEPGWTSMMRRGTDSTRTDSPNLYYPIYVDPETKTIKKIGTSIPLGQDRAEEIPGLVQVLPLRRNGTQGRWQVGNVELKNRIRQGRLRLGRPTAYGFVINYLPDGEYAKVINGEYEIQSYAADGSMVAFKKEHRADELRMPPTQWKIASHNASENGTTLLTTVIGEKRFPFPKSLYAVRDTLRFFVAENPNALIVDFFAGSGTTLHAVNLLNAEDGGYRRCIMVTNNEVSDDEAKALRENGYQPGDAEWEKLGIARYVTWPRTVCSIKGVDVNGNELSGNYGCEIEKMVEVEGEITDPNTGKKLRGTFFKKAKEAIYPTLSKIRMGDGFAANAKYFKLGFLDWIRAALN